MYFYLRTDNAILLNYCKAVLSLQLLLSSVNASRGLFWREELWVMGVVLTGL